jgi:hypothetical protein
MSDQPTIIERIDRLKLAVEGWLSLKCSDAWDLVEYDCPDKDRDPRRIIAAYEPDNPIGTPFRHDPYKRLRLVREVFSESDCKTALAAETDLAEQGPLVAEWLLRWQDDAAAQCAKHLLTFLADRTRNAAERLPRALQVVEVRAIQTEGLNPSALTTDPPAEETAASDSRPTAKEMRRLTDEETGGDCRQEQLLDTAREEESPPQAESVYQFKRDSDSWVIRCHNETAKLWTAQLSGLPFVARMFQSPLERVSVEQLTPVVGDPGAGSSTDHPTDHTFGPEGRGDVKEQAAYLAGEIERARNAGNHLREQECMEALERLHDFHKKDKQKNGRSRRMKKTPAEKATERVRQAISAVREKLKERCPKLAAHIEQIHKHGTGFIYTPPKPPPVWDICLE